MGETLFQFDLVYEYCCEDCGYTFTEVDDGQTIECPKCGSYEVEVTG